MYILCTARSMTESAMSCCKPLRFVARCAVLLVKVKYCARPIQQHVDTRLLFLYVVVQGRKGVREGSFTNITNGKGDLPTLTTHTRKSAS